MATETTPPPLLPPFVFGPTEFNDNARTVLEKRYLIRDENGNPTETPEDLFLRVATTIASIDAQYGASSEEIARTSHEFYHLMTERLFEPNSPTLVNAGRPLGQLSACFVLPVADEISNGKDGIYDTLRSMALVHQSGGGTGFSFSQIRPTGSIVRSTTGVASGPISFMSLYDASTEVVKQGGVRRGANMAILRVDHPDILAFIDCKQDTTKITNFNISVAVTDAFMAAVANDTAYDLIDPRNGATSGQLAARSVFDKIVHNAWATGEPGLFFIDQANRFNPVPHLGSYEATNPCVTGDTTILTTRGPRTFADLAADAVKVDVIAVDRKTGERVVRTMRRPRLTRRNAEIIEIAFDSGLSVRCTPDHSWIAPDSSKIAAAELTPGDSVMAISAYVGTRAPHQRRPSPGLAFTNHRVLSVTAAGTADVYNGTVDDVHTYVVCDPASIDDHATHTGIVSANCGEQALLPYDVCNLGSINVGSFVRPDVAPTAPWDERIDWKKYRTVIRSATHFLDNVIDANQYPLPEITALAHDIRRIGLGIMGFADLLVRLGIPYNSAEGVEVGRRIMAFLDSEAKDASENLAAQRGTFPEWDRSIWGPDESCARNPDGSRIRPEKPLRNCNITTVAPTGTISIIAGCSSGIEPLFAVAFMRNQAGVMMPDVNPDFVAIAHAGGWHSDELIHRIAEEGHIHFDEIPQTVQNAFVTAHDIAPEWHIRMQAAFQESCDSAISKTCNFSHEATEDDVRVIYDLAHTLRCKGVTVYRDGSRSNQVLSTGKTDKNTASATPDQLRLAQQRIEQLETALATTSHAATPRRQKRSRPETLHGTTRKMNSPLGDVFITINEDEKGNPFEMFAVLGKAGSIATADAEAIGRLISLSLRSGISVTDIHAQLRGISSDRAIGFGANKVLSVPDAIAQAIELRQNERHGVQQELLPASYGELEQTFMDLCPECRSTLTFSEGCRGGKCTICAYSACS